MSGRAQTSVRFNPVYPKTLVESKAVDPSPTKTEPWISSVSSHGRDELSFQFRRMAELNSKRVSLSEAKAIAEAQGLELPERQIGYFCPLDKGDKVTFDGDIFLTTMGKSIVDENGVFAKGNYWVRESTHIHAGATLHTDVAASSFSRSGKKFPTRDEQVRVNGKLQDNLSGFGLYESVLESLNLDAKTRQLNLDLSKPEGEIAKLTRLAGRTLEVIASFKAYTLRMNTKDEADWGSKPAHWRPTNILFWKEVVTTTKKGNK